jgi:hypothetical protein
MRTSVRFTSVRRSRFWIRRFPKIALRKHQQAAKRINLRQIICARFTGSKRAKSFNLSAAGGAPLNINRSAVPFPAPKITLRFSGIRIKQLHSVDRVVRDRGLPFGRNEKIDELLAELLFYVWMLRLVN